MHGVATEPSHGHDATDGDHRPSSPRTEPDGDNLRTPPRGRREEILDGASEMFAEHGYNVCRSGCGLTTAPRAPRPGHEDPDPDRQAHRAP